MRILVADDERYTREGIVSSLDWQKYGIDCVMQAEDGEQALEIASWLQPEIVLTDIRMPKKNGIEFVEELKKTCTGSHILFMSSYVEIEYLKSAIRLSAVEYIQKPLNMAELEDALQKTVSLVHCDRQHEQNAEQAQELYTLMLTCNPSAIRQSRLPMQLHIPEEMQSWYTELTLNEQERAWAESVWSKIVSKMAWVSEKSRDKIPYLTVNGVHDDRSATDRAWSEGDGLDWWTNGFWGGLMWLMYHETNDHQYAEIAAISEKKLDACFESFNGLHHDVGFMWRPTAAADYDLTGNPVSLKRALHAANLLAGRFNPAGNYIRAWNSAPGGENDNVGWAIIDCMMNLSLLYWAAEKTGDPRFRHIAMRHADTAMNAFVREDGSVRHIVVFDPESGRYLHSLGGQGYAHGSSWTRGQGWGVYGFMISYRHTGEMSYLRTAERIADYIVPHIPESGLIPVDFCQPAEPAWEDSCGACVIACGLLELAKAEIIPAQKRALYLEKALQILRAIDEKRADWSDGCDSIVLGCSGAYHDRNHHFTMVYADYYFVEAIAKLRGSKLWMW